jgi:restriction endonuclease S subunit
MTRLITDGAHVSPEVENGVYDFVSTKDLATNGINFDGCIKTSEESYLYLVANGCRPQKGDVLFSKDGTIGRTVVVNANRDFVVASSLIIIRPDMTSSNSLFFNYLCQSSIVFQQVESFVKGAGLPRLSIQNLLKVRGIFPPLPIQEVIAAYLDKETVRIDTLIAKKERQIELLQEKRQAIITRAITKGLNPKAKMKDSGVEWIGEIPDGWERRKFSHCVSIQEGQVDPELPQYSCMLLIAPNHIESNTGRLIKEETAEDQAAESGKYYCRKGDVVYSKIRPKLAKATIAPRDALCSADMYPMRGKKIVINDYLLFVLLSDSFTKWAVLESDRVAMPKLNRETMSDFYLPIPPLDEQMKAISMIKQMNDYVFSTIDKIRKSLFLLQEYRSSLITAAVSGQINVSQEVPK